MFSCYLKLEQRQTIKKGGTESITPRYVVTRQNGYFKPLESLKSKEGDIVMYYQRTDKCNPNSRADTRLQCKGSVNFSSLYFENSEAGQTLLGYGEPPQTETLKNSKGTKPNPFFENRGDGYLFIVSPDSKIIEILIVPSGRSLIRGYLAKLADGRLDIELERLRKTASSYSKCDL